MGSFNTLYTFLSSHVLPQNNNNTTIAEDVKEYTQPATKTRHHRTFSDPSSAMLPKETVQKLFPCDNRHSFNPHYQHNLHTTSSSTIYSTPPSLASSPTDSSPSSTASSSHSHTTSSTYTMTQATQKPFYQQPHPRRSQSASSTRRQQQQQQQQYHNQRHYNYSNSRQQARRLSQRGHATHHDIDNMDDDILIGYDNQQIYYGSGSSTSMARVHPSGSPPYDTHPSFSSSSDRQHQQEHARSGYISAMSYPPRLSENERTVSPASRSLFAAAASAVKSSIQYGQASSSSQSKPQYPQHQQQQHHQGRQQRRAEHVRHQSASHFLPSISERRATMHMHEEEDVYAFDYASEVAAASTSAAGEIRTVSASKSSSSLSSSSSTSSSTPITAKQSLLRIARCDPRQDNWCSQQSGQWTRLYAQTRSNGPLADGRRTRRL
ncbi:hypothetical protein BGX30_008770 [Mortierella sp. GBA39]|nr:hypothetical protein BGX30_008770 [Mortierella sp. GBA39]